MAHDITFLLLANSCYWLAGSGVLRTLGGRRSGRDLPARVGLAYVLGVATIGVAGQLLLVLGAALTIPEVVGLSALFYLIGFLRRPTPYEPGPLATARAARVIPLVVGFLLCVLMVMLVFEPLGSWDAWGFWTPKAESIVIFHGLNHYYFTAPTTFNPEYPLLLPTIEAIGFRFMGSFDTQVIHLQFGLLLTGFVLALVALLRQRVSAQFLWMSLALVVAAPLVWSQSASAYADVPLGIFFALAAISAYLWIETDDRFARNIAVVFASAALATKLEGRLYVGVLVVVVASLAFAGSRRQVFTVCAGALLSSIGIVPWLLWTHHYGIKDPYSFRPERLSEELHRAPATVAHLAANALSPRYWLFLPVAVLILSVAALTTKTSRRVGGYVLTVTAISLIGLVWAYLNSPYPFHWQLETSSYRVVIPLVLFWGAALPLLADATIPGSQPSVWPSPAVRGSS